MCAAGGLRIVHTPPFATLASICLLRCIASRQFPGNGAGVRPLPCPVAPNSQGLIGMNHTGNMVLYSLERGGPKGIPREVMGES